MKICVTGGAGFIASHVVERLLELGHEVVVVFDKEKPGKIPHLEDRVQWIQGNVMNSEDCERAVDGAEAVIHLAALISVDDSILHPRIFWDNNVGGTMLMIEASRQARVKRFVYMSTAEVYGHIPYGRADETYPCDPRSPYAASKYAAERYCLSWYATYGQPEVVVLRGFNTYGPRQTAGAKGAVVATFIIRCLKGLAPQVRGDGEQRRDFVYVEDMAEAIVKATLYDSRSFSIGGLVFNLATGQSTAIVNLAKAIVVLTEGKPEIQHIVGRMGENTRSVGHAWKAKKYLGWSPEMKLQEGLMKTIEYYREALG